ncbi:MAG: UdgX family uracil-DNA binding protein, partial [Planctomycetota bacterium]
PDDSVAWDGRTLRYGAGIDSAAAQELAGEDVLEESWKTYYANIFNPARIKLDAMRAEMPVKHWRTLPETQIIPDLLADAPRRVEQMMAATKTANQPTAEQFVPNARSLPVLREAATDCAACELCEPGTVTQVVFGEGPEDARIVFVGEQPGDQEDKVGRPFVGPAGQLLDALLVEAGVDRPQVYVTNTVKHFRHEPKGKFRLHQKPLARHINACRPWLEAEMQAVSPDIVVALGSTAAQAIMGRQFRVTKSRGQWMACEFAPKFMATIHPSALLRIPDENARAEATRQFVEDLRQVAVAMP